MFYFEMFFANTYSTVHTFSIQIKSISLTPPEEVQKSLEQFLDYNDLKLKREDHPSSYYYSEDFDNLMNDHF